MAGNRNTETEIPKVYLRGNKKYSKMLLSVTKGSMSDKYEGMIKYVQV